MVIDVEVGEHLVGGRGKGALHGEVGNGVDGIVGVVEDAVSVPRANCDRRPWM